MLPLSAPVTPTHQSKRDFPYFQRGRDADRNATAVVGKPDSHVADAGRDSIELDLRPRRYLEGFEIPERRVDLLSLNHPHLSIPEMLKIVDVERHRLPRYQF